MDSSATLVANEFDKFHNFHLFVLEATTEICSAKWVFSNWGKEPQKSLKLLTIFAERLRCICLTGSSYATKVRLNYLVFFFITSQQSSSKTLSKRI